MGYITSCESKGRSSLALILLLIELSGVPKTVAKGNDSHDETVPPTSDIYSTPFSTQGCLLASFEKSTVEYVTSTEQAPEENDDDPEEMLTTLERLQKYVFKDTNVLQYINVIKNDFIKEIVREQLVRCPFVPQCDFALDTSWIEPPDGKGSCCRNCRCDISKCKGLNDCCPDIFSEEEINQTSISTCIPLSLKLKLGQDGVLGIQKCSDGTGEELENNCTRSYTYNITSILDIVPCESNLTSKVYRNKYCALCNGVLEQDITYFYIDIKDTRGYEDIIVNEAELIQMALTTNYVRINFINATHQPSCKTAIDVCNVTGKWEVYDYKSELACRLYRSEVFQSNKWYKNIFCAKCNGVLVTELFCRINRDYTSSFSFSGLLKPSTLIESSLNYNRCTSSEYFSPVLNRCIAVSCSHLHIVQQRNCLEKFVKIEKIQNYVTVRIIPLQTTSISTVYEHSSQILARMNDAFNLNYQSDGCADQILYSMRSKTEENLLPSNEMIYFDLVLRSFIPEESENAFKFYQIVDTWTIDFHNQDFSVLINGKAFNFRAKIIQSDHESSDYLQSLSCNDIGNLTAALLESFTTMGGETLVPRLSQCELDHGNGLCTEVIRDEWYRLRPVDIYTVRSCSRVVFDLTEHFWIKHYDGTITLDRKFILDSNMYSYLNSSDIYKIEICAEAYDAFLNHNNGYSSSITLSQRTEITISRVCSALSVFSLGATFITFCLLPNLRSTIPGINNLSLVGSLLAAQVMFLISSANLIDNTSNVCKVVGCALHFLLLLSMFWMNVCTFHMFRVLTSNQVVSKTGNSTKVLIYHVYSLLSASMLVVVNVLVSYFRYGTSGYGRVTCYLSYPEMLYFTFALPTAVVILSNLFMFCRVIFRISFTPSVHKVTNRNRNDLVIFTKLSTITGIAWIFGLVNMWANVVVLDYLFSILNASQGIFIFLSFVINKRVANSYMEKFSSIPVSFNSWNSRDSNRIKTI